ncbi:mucin-22-like [Heterodontus francisci]|uniref:mucin-22-like n=1 Tax=Heterodontus francisci TaxID=7792 RepID=UPI00355AF7D7
MVVNRTVGLLLLCIALSSNVVYMYASTTSEPGNEANTTLSYWNMTSDYNMTWTDSYENMTVNTTEFPANFSCQTFNCSGHNCYEKYNSWEECPETHMYCELYRSSNTSYWAGCSNNCAGTTNICRNSSLDMCTIECCNTTLCLMLNGEIQELPGEDEMTTYQPMESTVEMTTEPTTMETPSTAPTTIPTTLTPTTPTTIGSGNKCAVISCVGNECYKNENNGDMYCSVGMDYCKLENTGSNTWTSSCDNSCNTVSSGCSSSSSSSCVQECCQATTESCLKLDGNEHLIGSATAVVSTASPVIAEHSANSNAGKCNMAGKSSGKEADDILNVEKCDHGT